MPPNPLPLAEDAPAAPGRRSAGRDAARCTGVAWLLAGVAMLGGCSASQAYLGALQWQRQTCQRIEDRAERTRCIQDLDLSYAEYRREAGLDGRDPPR